MRLITMRLVAMWIAAPLLAAAAGAACAAAPPAPPPAVTAPAVADGAHDFDFEIGSWQAHLSRRLHPLTGSTIWVDYDGTSVVRPVWDGKANLGELRVAGNDIRIEGLSLRLYNPGTRQWTITWVNAADGALTPPMIGGFANGRGLFYGQDTLGGRAILARFIFSDISARNFRLEQAFSADGGQTWEVNWISSFSR